MSDLASLKAIRRYLTYAEPTAIQDLLEQASSDLVSALTACAMNGNTAIILLIG
ncbi:MAG: hypothetical protein LBU32_15080 [Clostridiales bacterium]|jgi:hypothetical protein|nr:hypothetical protein [Clostridiales bacterium]